MEAPIVLAQDYHFALLPRMVKEARPDAEWRFSGTYHGRIRKCLEFVRQRELIDGLLGADLIAFHTQTHCNNYWRPWTEPWKR